MRRILFFIALTLALMSCRSVRVEYVRQVRDSIQVRTELRVDTCWKERYHEKEVKGDTIIIRDSIIIGSSSLRDRSDTLLVHDSIPYPVEVKVPVPYRRSYDKAMSAGFWILLVFVAAWIALRIYLRWYRVKR